MKLFSFIKSLTLIVSIILISACCKPGDGGASPSFPTYSYTTSIVNPPDLFKVNYIISTPGPKTANITFDSDAVWIVEKQGDSRIVYTINNGSNVRTIITRDTIGFKGGLKYEFAANNLTGLDITNYLVNFSKTSDSYTTYPDKF